ncbi:hypothetical protein FRC19_002130 [Serendipita sp. 401]|nr:hypothetical protein FRC19_002130 [Serendipita sp. 401]
MSSTKTLRLPNDELRVDQMNRKLKKNTKGDYKRLSLALLAVSLTLGTLYSVVFETYLDTSDPILAHLPHPSHKDSYFARKSNVFNQLFVKKAWAWTSGAFGLLYWFSPSEKRGYGGLRLWRYTIATLVWMLFTTWFFGPALFERLMTYSGGECVIAVPPSPLSPGSIVGGTLGGSPTIIKVPLEYCHTKSTITKSSHPQLFSSSLILPPDDFRGRPRLYKGHDVSGHIFLLTLAISFLTDQLTLSLLPKPRVITQTNAIAINLTLALLAIWWWMSIMTSVYFHSPREKLSGFAIGVIGYLFTLIPYPFQQTPRKIGAPIPEDKLRHDAMHLD